MTENHMSQATYGGSFIAIVGGMSLNEVLAACGLVMAIAGFIVNFIFRWRQDRRLAAQYQAWERGEAARIRPEDGN